MCILTLPHTSRPGPKWPSHCAWAPSGQAMKFRHQRATAPEIDKFISSRAHMGQALIHLENALAKMHSKKNPIT